MVTLVTAVKEEPPLLSGTEKSAFARRARCRAGRSPRACEARRPARLALRRKIGRKGCPGSYGEGGFPAPLRNRKETSGRGVGLRLGSLR